MLMGLSNSKSNGDVGWRSIEFGVCDGVPDDDPHSLRLVIGTRLDVTEEIPEIREGDPDAPAYAVYDYLGWLLEQAVNAISADRRADPGSRR